MIHARMSACRNRDTQKDMYTKCTDTPTYSDTQIHTDTHRHTHTYTHTHTHTHSYTQTYTHTTEPQTHRLSP